MQNYVQRGDTLTVAAPYALPSGGGCQVGNIFGVAVNNQNLGDATELVVEGVFDLAKDASTFNSGDKVYWNNSHPAGHLQHADGRRRLQQGNRLRGPEPAGRHRRRRAARPPMRRCACGSTRSASARCRRPTPIRR